MPVARTTDDLHKSRLQTISIISITPIRRKSRSQGDQTHQLACAVCSGRMGNNEAACPVNEQRFPQDCGGMGIRTPGLVIANDALYQLSYTPCLAGVRLTAPQRFSRTRATLIRPLRLTPPL